MLCLASSLTVSDTSIVTYKSPMSLWSQTYVSNHILAHEASALVVAESGTTVVTLTYLVWAVLLNLAVQRRLEEEGHARAGKGGGALLLWVKGQA